MVTRQIVTDKITDYLQPGRDRIDHASRKLLANAPVNPKLLGSTEISPRSKCRR
jgi:hypothetical protein